MIPLLPFDSIEDFVQSLGIPVGGILVGLALGVGLFATAEWLRHRPAKSVVGTVPIRLVADPSESAAPTPGTAAPLAAPVTVSSAEGSRTVFLRGAGLSPNAPLPRARRFLAILAASFVALSTIELALFARLFLPYDHLVGYAGTALFWPTPWPGVYAVNSASQLVPDYIFPMYLAAMAAFAIASGLLYRRPALPAYRRALALGLIVLYVGVEVILDAVFFTVPGQLVTVRNLAIVVRTMTGGVFLSGLVFCAMFLPTPQQVKPRFRRDPTALYQFFGTGIIAVSFAAASLVLVDRYLGDEGVLLPFTLLLLLPLVTLETFIALNRPLYFRQIRRRPLPPLSEYHPSVSIVMPAFNEERWIAESIRHADVAAGKSNGLNGALALATGEIVIRLDADTFISDRLGFSAIIPHFSDPEVGGVQGSIHPRQRKGWTRKLRALEIAWGHYFQRPAVMGARSGEVIDGLFSAFRRKDLVALGGWVPWNGEDTELSMRIQRLGYRVRLEF
ncbi:MAG: glycosyltransferase, partial [Thermoplasmata archaeon]|nr:glycosyltransferase [Thermoplasmata archaeon]